MSKQKNILLIMTDQLNPDYVSYSDNAKAFTPNIDRIAEGISFNNAVTTNPVCTPARCSILTGKYPHQVGMMTMSGCLNTDYPTYAKALKVNGYQTSAIGKLHLLQGWHWDIPVGKGHNLVELNSETKKYGFDFVWEAAGKGLMLKNYCDYAKFLDEKGLLDNYRNELIRRENPGHPEFPSTSESFGISEKNHVEYVITDKVIEQIKNRDKDRPFSIFCSYLSPHPMIDPPQRFLDQEVLDLNEEFLLKDGQQPLSDEMKQRWCENRQGYRALVRFVDVQIERLFDALQQENILNDTVIIFTSDHGDVLGNYRIDGKNLPWRECSTVPLAIRHPDYLFGRKINAPVSLIDVTATMLDIANIDYKKELSLFWPAWNHVVPCRSLMPIIKDESERVREYTFTENDAFEMIQTEQYKYVHYRTNTSEYTPPVELLFDLLNDKLELKNIVDNEKHHDILTWCREMRDYTLNSTPCGQVGWAPVQDMSYTIIKEYAPK